MSHNTHIHARLRSLYGRTSRIVKLNISCFVAAALVGIGATILAVLKIEPGIGMPAPGLLAVSLFIGFSTVINLLARFVRWQYLLRQLGIRVRTIPSLGAFTGSFAFLPVPLYIGQLIARIRLAPLDEDQRRSYLVLGFLWERSLDVWAVSLLACPALPYPLNLAILVLCAAVALPFVRRGLLRIVLVGTRYLSQVLFKETVQLVDAVGLRVTNVGVFAASAATSLLAWAIPVSALYALTWTGGAPIGLIAATSEAAHAILMGALSLIPVGAGLTGLVMIENLEEAGVNSDLAAQVTFIYRAATAWFIVAIGVVSLLFHRWRLRQPIRNDHFDEIDHHYDAWLPVHYRNYLVTKKTTPMIERIRTLGPGAKGLDIGCGRGWYFRVMRQFGLDVTMLDLSFRQLRAAQEYAGGRLRLVQGSVLKLPFRSAAFDFAYIINVLHHLPSPLHQSEALREIATVVRPGGLVFVHEMNVANPVFRLYLSYLYPILKGVEEGNEHYMHPCRLLRVEELALSDLEYFTFVPDFIPPRLLPIASSIESRLESTWLKRYSAHYMAVYVRTN